MCAISLGVIVVVLPSLVYENSVTPDLCKWEPCFARGRALSEAFNDGKQFCSVTENVYLHIKHKHATEIHWQKNEHLNARLETVESKKKENWVDKLR